jgi:hypothetical protein
VLDDITTTTPGNPPAGKHKIVDRMGNIFVRNSSGAETIIASAAGNSDGEKNYITNPSGAASISGWANVGDLDIVRTATAAELPREFSTKTGLKITANSLNQTVDDYVYFDFSIDDVDMSGQFMKIKWDQKLTGTYLAGELAVVITTQADRNTAVSTPFTSAIPASDGTFQTYFLAPATATCSMVIRCTGEMATDGGIVISDVVVGPNVQVQGAAIGPWKSYTPTTQGLGTISVFNCLYREVGSMLELDLKWTCGTTVAAEARWSLPTGFTSLSSGAASISIVGKWWKDNGTSTNIKNGTVLITEPNGFMQFGNDSEVASTSPITPKNGNDIFATSQSVWVRASIRVAELSSNVTLANRAVEEYASHNGSAVVKGPNGCLIPTTTPAGTYELLDVSSGFSNVQSTDSFVLEINEDGAGSWVPVGTPYVEQTQFDGTNFIGACVRRSGTTIAGIFRGKYRQTAGSTAGTWVTIAANTMWRVRKVSGGASVGYPISSANIVGTLPTIQTFKTGGSSSTYTTPANTKWIKVRMVGGGGGGSGSGNAAAGAGGVGGDSTFGVLFAGGGVGGYVGTGSGGAGGSSSLGSGPIGMEVTGSYGLGFSVVITSGAVFLAGGMGGDAPMFSGGGRGGWGNSPGYAGTTNTGGGGQGGGSGPNSTNYAGCGGGSGGFVEAIITTLSPTYSYSVGNSGTAGSAGTNGFVGGAGASGQIIVEEYYL